MVLEKYIKKLNIINNLNVIKINTDNTIDISVNGKIYKNMKIVKPFPISRPEIIMLVNNDIVFTLKDYRDNKILNDVVSKIYFTPKIIKILSLDTSGDEFIWKVETNYGTTEITTRGRSSVMRFENRIVIIDTSDIVYEIEDISKIDKKSRKLIENII
ncbi:DUF1854 domain-containing protein [Acidianus sulfidivorans JP7]|uniref:DUF1854 domain-containing protein n=1 Tax=Acidianus sulfidivorans JP7 TaxID=619593 RepID=A0A2U9ILK6_9CREN|nr:DUF1854 domain-containing protein [Acidianus sulfidivorans]AWR96875.1 DUF1854 domain-containing protein [Acidianus sulfidivorans JP7]